ncbi:hypothetical protein DFH11DRAFT_1685268 [Phellopilus nigrolimitatus]|nr:hypothetical protein DFH11DRAFT_1685268 [Phellopilus nigrolimitatus]
MGLMHHMSSAFALRVSGSSISHIPAEIILAILEAAYYDDNLEPDTQFLANCAIVCKSWSAPSQSLLFRHVFLRSSSAFSSFRSAVGRCTSRARALADVVVRLRITLDYNHPDQLSHRALALAVRLCPNLYELDISLYGCGVPVLDPAGAAGAFRVFRAAPSFDAVTLALLREGPRIRSLRLANWSDNDQLAVQLLWDVWPSLTAVALKGTPPRMPAADDEPWMPFNCNLSELRLSFQTSPKMDFVKWLLSSSIRSLRCLELEREPSMELLNVLLHQHGSSLESLSIPSCTSRGQASAVQSCERLREIRIESAMISPLLLKQLPDTLEHLAFALSRDTPLYLVVNFVKARDNLKAVTVHFWNGGDTHPLLPSLRIACACRGVELIDIHRIRQFREAVRGDPIPFTAFPRTKEPGNLLRMLYITRTLSRAPLTQQMITSGSAGPDSE